MKKNKLISMVVISIIVVAGVFFYEGMKYAQGKAQNAFSGVNGFQPRTGMGNRTGGMRTGINGGFVAGEVIAKDATSMTIKLQDGGSKIVFFTPTTPIMKTTAGISDDIAIGKTVSITGKANPDGSVNADQIQLRSAPPQTQQTN